ncbi:DUF3103 family protein [Shewanella salipaludis]|uniref:DUF3103 family protein n=1 Tax=Shewanella salipaludis TaxID=2723052 RepID=A0A972FYB5_9GAMM|nr:DUF3103 family protein [Shewanella salipaludis]NMH64892.1 DUF3103 family protein [Shewanella salipaludis]
MKKITSTLILLLSASSLAVQAKDREAADFRLADTQVNLADSKRDIALNISAQYAKLAPILREKITQYDLVINADELLSGSTVNGKTLRQADQHIRHAKGLDEMQDSLVQLRLADESMVADWQQGENPLFAYAPDGDDSHWDYIEAFDVQGNIHQLDVYNLPDQPVFVIGLDEKKAFQAGMEQMRQTFAAHLADGTAQAKALSLTTLAETNPISTTLIKEISLQDDMEPWISGKAEIYGIVTGVDPSRDEPMLDVVEMPYLDYAESSYYPNQVVIHWDRYRWGAADMILMEHDDGTNYKDLASKLLEAATAIMKLIPDPEVQQFAIIPQITNGILSAMPDAWFTNDDDYVDVYYTLMEGQQYLGRKGASANATATFEPLIIQPR